MTGKITFAAFAAILFSLFVFAPSASADVAFCPPGAGAGQCSNPEGVAVDRESGRLYVADSGNNRIDVFESNAARTFVLAFGWGVADGAAELQSCGPMATPPTASCRKGLEGGGAGEFGNPFARVPSAGVLTGVAVDNDAASPSHHDIYAMDGLRVQKFDPEGHFLLAWGGGAITGGAAGSGDLVSGSKEITAVKTTEKQFEAGQTIAGSGIPAGTRIVALGPGTITLSKAATASGTVVGLSVAAGSGNVPVNEVDTAINKFMIGPPNLRFSTPNPSPSKLEIVPPPIAENASGAELQARLEALSNIGAGNVKVTGEKVEGEFHEYTIEFAGPRFSDTDVLLERGLGPGGGEVLTVKTGGGAAEICTAAIAASCSRGVEGTEHGQFDVNPRLAVGPGGAVYVVDCVRIGSEASPCKDRLQKFSPAGAFVEELQLPQSPSLPTGFAVDSGGDFYVSVNVAIRKYDPAGNLIGQLPVARGVGALALDASDDLFAAEVEGNDTVIAEYDPAGKTLRRFGYGVLKSNPSGLSPYLSGEGDIYTSEGGSAFYRSFPAPGPVLAPRPCAVKAGGLGNTTATLQAEINPEGKATSFRFEYLTQAQFENGGFSNLETKDSAEVPLSGAVDFFLHEASLKVAGLAPETVYHCQVVTKNADGEAPAGVEGVFKTREGFEFGPAWASQVGEESTTVNAEGNPLEIPAKGQIEYVEDSKYRASGFAEALSAPAAELDYGAGKEMVLRSVTLSGLTPGTLYHYRLRARNGTPPEGIVCPEQKLVCPELEHTFRTYLPEPNEFDHRGYELVSPGEKNNAEVAVPGNAGGFVEPRSIRIQAGAGSGDAITYTSWTSFGDPEGAPATSQYLSKRTPSGWATGNISPFGFLGDPLFPPYSGFSSDLRYGAFKVTEPALTADCREGSEDLYLRDNDTGALHCLTPAAPESPEACFVYAGASEDGSHAFFAGRPSGGEDFTYGLYEWTAAKGLRVVSVLPGKSEAVAATHGTSFGPRGSSFAGAENCQIGRTILRHVVSADGSRAFWTYVPESESEPTQLLVRVNGSETVQLDAKQTVAGPSGNGVFRAASDDGSVAYFTDTERLISGAKAEAGAPDLYRYELGQAKPLTDLTKGAVPGGVQGVVGASDDGSYVYFVATAVLSGEEKSSAGEKAEAGKSNLYLYHEGETTFIATLAPADERDWESQPNLLSARVSPDGRHLAFLSIEAEKLAGYDNTLAKGEHCQYKLTIESGMELVGSPSCPQAFVFDADTGKLSCASCNPSGARPLGPTVLPGWTNVYEGPRYLSDNGSRLFFQSYDALLQADVNGKGDVYEFERSGEGTCNTGNPNFDPASGGCHFLVSGGRSDDESYLLDASSNGRDAFFSTRRSLVGWDLNDNFDVYDFREGGGFPEPPEPPPPCVGEGCKSPPTTPPQAPSPTTPAFSGPGNVKPKQPKPKKHHKKNKKKQAHKKHRSQKRRGGR